MTEAELAATVRDAVLAVPGVVRLTPGGPVEAVTFYPGGTVVGVRLGDPVQVRVEVDPVPIGPLADRIRQAVQTVLERHGERPGPIEIFVDDLAVDDRQPVEFGTAARR
ncbi:hypothetical protein AB0J86_30375 [Micromonospora sp. NPDC049559]|uniref:hypothetical protein n=1 Tax=Micromonospora sp. NPDC049559 TaxID=3155923 RepID=UPI003443FCFC